MMRWLLALGLICCALPASAVERLSLAEMADGAEYIVEGTVVRSWTVWDTAHHSIWTHYELSVRKWLKAPAASDRTIVVSEPSDDATAYTAGEHVVVLAWRTPEGFLQAAGQGQGKFTVTRFPGSRDQRLRWSPQGVNMVRDARGPDELLDGMRLDEFRTYIRRFVRFEGERRTAE